ncbi:hypothetical protein Scep_002550 [Stephania cephalantha]|uniref:Uncharacterized protein n=1 Tax=Stephania cephalantha TaxID=152367 RepID=A0AAP0LES0_9MAGN
MNHDLYAPAVAPHPHQHQFDAVPEIGLHTQDMHLYVIMVIAADQKVMFVYQ